jgi:zinc/manganese transport system substrate-binding protein
MKGKANMMIRRMLLSIALLAMLVSLSPQTHSQAHEGDLKVVATFTILADVAQQVAGEQAQVVSLMPIGSDPHTFIASPQDVATLVEADVVLSNGANFEEGLLDILSANAEDIHEVVASSCVPIWSFEAHDHAEGEEHSEGEAHSEEADHAEGEAHSDDHDHVEGEMKPLDELCESHWAALAETVGGLPAYFEATEGPLYALECSPHEHEEGEEHSHAEGCDPHVWMDPHNVILWTVMIRDTLSSLDPDHADVYSANAEAYITQLVATIAPNSALLAAIPAEERILITSHNTFGYLANPAEFEVVEGVIPGGGTAGEPSAAEFVDLIELIAETEVPAIFTENTTPPALVQQLADETGVRVELLYTDSLGPADSPASTYLDLLNYNVAAIATALGG